MPRLTTGLLLVLLFEGAACSKPPSGSDQFARGARLYDAYCASCHETDTGIGPKLTRHVLATRNSALSLYAYNKRNMPYEAGNSLPDEEYWSITAYLLKRHGFLDPSVYLTTEQADTLTLLR